MLIPVYSDELYHHGIKGQKWGVRRYQNPDGSLTPEGIKRYGAQSSDSAITKRAKNDLITMDDRSFRRKYSVTRSEYMKRIDKWGDPYMNSPYAKAGKKLAAKKTLETDNKKAKAKYEETIRKSRYLDREGRIAAKIKASEVYNMDLAAAKAKYTKKMDAIEGIIKNSYAKKLINDDTRAELDSLKRRR